MDSVLVAAVAPVEGGAAPDGQEGNGRGSTSNNDNGARHALRAKLTRPGGKRKRGEEDMGREASDSRMEDGGSDADEDRDEGGEGDGARRRAEEDGGGTASDVAAAQEQRGMPTRGRKREREGGTRPGGAKKAKTGDG